jgi:hypothetical protein
VNEIDERMTGADVDDHPNWGRRLLWAGGLFVVVVLATLVASATVPRWWAQRVGDQVDGSITQGTTLGLVYGFVFTFLPIMGMVILLRWRRTWKAIIGAVLLGVFIALPNLMTLSIVLGRGNAAHAGERILDVEAPAFRGGSLAGAIVAVLLSGFIVYLMVSRDQARSKEQRARDELREAGAPRELPPESPES